MKISFSIFSYILILSSLFPNYLLAQGDYPIPPKTNRLMFYIQRNHNGNTIVYEANFDRSGNLNEEEPLLVSWIRYDEQGQRMPLRRIERWYAYGFDIEEIEGEKKSYTVELKAYDKRKLSFKQVAPNKAKIYLKINGKESELDHLYIQADNSSVWPKVEYVELFGFYKGQKVYEKIMND